jgi:putative transposase
VFIELGSRRISLSPSTAHPESAWVTQQARNLALDLDARGSPVRFLIRDRDAKFCRGFDEVVRSECTRVIRTPIQAPNANAHAERVIETIRAEVLDWTLILGRRHLDRTLRTYAAHYNRGRPHRALGLASPLAEASLTVSVPVSPCDVRRRDLLGGLIHEYHAAAACSNLGFRSPPGCRRSVFGRHRHWSPIRAAPPLADPTMSTCPRSCSRGD